MQIQIDHASERAVYQQIIDQIKRDIALGRLKTGEKLATVRQLAAQLLINPNTIAKAYRTLEQEKIIVTKSGSGAFIAPLNTNLSMDVREKIIAQQLERVAVDAVHMRIGRKTLTKWFNQTLDQFNLETSEGSYE
jgi:GntR family transcriptional regulator